MSIGCTIHITFIWRRDPLVIVEGWQVVSQQSGLTDLYSCERSTVWEGYIKHLNNTDDT